MGAPAWKAETNAQLLHSVGAAVRLHGCTATLSMHVSRRVTVRSWPDHVALPCATEAVFNGQYGSDNGRRLGDVGSDRNIEVNDPRDWRVGRTRFTQRLLFVSAEAAWDRRSAAGQGRCSVQEQGVARSAASAACPAVPAVSGLDHGYAWPVPSKMYAEFRAAWLTRPSAPPLAVHTSEAWMCMRSIPGAQVGIV